MINRKCQQIQEKYEIQKCKFPVAKIRNSQNDISIKPTVSGELTGPI